MTDPLFACVDHGFYARATDAETAACPDCGAAGEAVIDGDRRRRLSTFLSGALRHFPDDAGLALDAAGWTAVEAVVERVDRRYGWAGEREVRAVVATDPKGRFERRDRGAGVELRAAYGHSVDVDLDADGASDTSGDPTADADVPETLYHGTAPRNRDAIRDEGLRPMGRQHVHLSGSRETATTVGRRHTESGTEPLVLAVDAAGLTAAGFRVRKRGVDTYTVDRVPPAFLGWPPSV
jgi:putative RNA 2'-phosphotransferase